MINLSRAGSDIYETDLFIYDKDQVHLFSHIGKPTSKVGIIETNSCDFQLLLTPTTRARAQLFGAYVNTHLEISLSRCSELY